MIYLDLPDDLLDREEFEEIINRVITELLVLEKIVEAVEVSVMITDSTQIKELNAQYRGRDEVTDVLSFALEAGGDFWPERPKGQPRLLGDIVIALDQLKLQAQEYGHSWQRELGFLVSHGLLHLLGYEHGEEDDENLQIMLKKQESVLEKLGLKR